MLEGYAAMPLWIEFRQALSIDHMLRIGNQELSHECTLQTIDDHLSHCGKHLTDFGLPSPQRRSVELFNEELYLRNNQASFHAESENMYQQLNEEQLHILHVVNDAIQNRRNPFFFVEGRPGRGKTFLVKAISSALRAQGRVVLIVGSTALSATAYDRGRTAHHMFGIPVTDDNVNLQSSIHPHSPRADLIRNTSIIIWDELPSMNKAGWECVDNICCIICKRGTPKHDSYCEDCFCNLLIGKINRAIHGYSSSDRR